MRYYGKGWWYEPQRHALAAQGVKTGVSKLGKGLAFTGMELGKTLYSGFSDEEAERFKQEESIQTQDSMSDYDDVLSQGGNFSQVEPQLEEPLGSLPADVPRGSHVAAIKEDEPLMDGLIPETPPPKDFKSRVQREVEQLRDLVHLEPMLFQKEASSIFHNILFDTDFYLKEGDVQSLQKQLVKIGAQKQLYKDKIALVDNVRQDVMSKKYYQDASTTRQFSDIEKVDKALETLMLEMNKIESSANKLKQQISAAERNKLIQPSKRFSDNKSIFPSFKEIFGHDAPKEKVPQFGTVPQQPVIHSAVPAPVAKPRIPTPNPVLDVLKDSFKLDNVLVAKGKQFRLKTKR